MKKIVILIAVLVLILFGYIAAGPFITIYQIKSSLEQDDSEKLSSYIDFPLLRTNMKEQFNALFMKLAAPDLKGNPFEALAMAFAPKLIEGMVDSFVTPTGLANLMSGEKPQQPKRGKVSQGSSDQRTEPFKNARYTYDSPNKFSAWVKDSVGKEEFRIVLTRDGLTWKLSNILMPTTLFGSNEFASTKAEAREKPATSTRQPSESPASEEDGLDAIKWYETGYKAAMAKRWKEAIGAFTKAIELNPYRAESYSNRGLAYRNLGNYKQAITDIDAAIELDPKGADFYINRALVYEDLGNYKQAIADFDVGIELKPKNAMAYFYRGLFYSTHGNYKQAIADFDVAIELDPKDANYYYFRGLLYRELGNEEQTFKNYKVAARLGHEKAQDYLTEHGIDDGVGNHVFAGEWEKAWSSVKGAAAQRCAKIYTEYTLQAVCMENEKRGYDKMQGDFGMPSSVARKAKERCERTYQDFVLQAVCMENEKKGYNKMKQYRN